MQKTRDIWVKSSKKQKSCNVFVATGEIIRNGQVYGAYLNTNFVQHKDIVHTQHKIIVHTQHELLVSLCFVLALDIEQFAQNAIYYVKFFLWHHNVLPYHFEQTFVQKICCIREKVKEICHIILLELLQIYAIC